MGSLYFHKNEGVILIVNTMIEDDKEGYKWE